jgi:predicted dehydrogenase
MKIAVVGAGEIGGLRARSVQQNPQTQLVAVVDVNRDNAARVASGTGARVETDVRGVLDDPKLDAVIVSTPLQFHAQAAMAALEAGKHVLCEKPLSNTVASCRAILEAARRNARTLAVGFNHRYYPSMKFVKAVVDAGRIGEVDHVRAFGGHDGLGNLKAEWMYKQPESGGGSMMDVGIHMTDLARFIVGEIVEVYGVARGKVWNVEGAEDNAVAIFKSTTGVPVFYQATWTEWKGYHCYIDVYGSRGMVRGYYAPLFNMLVTQDKPGARRKKSYQLYPEYIVREKLKGWQSTTLISFQEELADFLRMISGQSVPLADGWSGVRAVEIAHAVYESTASGRPVVLSVR